MDSMFLCKTARGRDMLCVNGFMFYLNKRKNDTSYWEYQQRKRQKDCKAVCKAKATTITDEDSKLVIIKQTEHTHSTPLHQKIFT